MKSIYFCAIFSIYILFCSCQSFEENKPDEKIDRANEKEKFTSSEMWTAQYNTGSVYIRKLENKTKLEIRVKIPKAEEAETDFDDITLMIYDSLARYVKTGKDERMLAPGLVCEKEYDKGKSFFYIYTIPYPQKVKK